MLAAHPDLHQKCTFNPQSTCDRSTQITWPRSSVPCVISSSSTRQTYRVTLRCTPASNHTSATSALKVSGCRSYLLPPLLSRSVVFNDNTALYTGVSKTSGVDTTRCRISHAYMYYICYTYEWIYLPWIVHISAFLDTRSLRVHLVKYHDDDPNVSELCKE